MTSIEDFTSQYGLVQKIDAFGYMKYLAENPDAPRKHGKVVLVTADTPLKASRGEGKTTTTIALIDALNKRGIDATAVLRQPSMGITAAGSKGGASGGGKASLTHPELIDWGLCGEMGAIEAAQNLLVSFAEKAVDDGKLDTILVPRVSEVPSRSLRAVPINPCPASTVCPGATSIVPLARFVRSTVPLHFARSPCRVPAAISGRARAGAASTTSRPFSKFRLAHENSPLSSREYSPVRSSSSVTAVPGCKPQLRSTAPARARCPVVRLP